MPFSIVSFARRLLPRALLPDVAIHGRHSRSWNVALDTKAEVWDLLVGAGIAQPATAAPRWWRKRVVVPLMPQHIVSLPGGCHALVPGAEALATLADKARFAQHVEDIGAAHLLPRAIDMERPSFPAVLKRTDLNAGKGVAVVTSPRELSEKLGVAPWVGQKVLLQELIPARTDYVAHLVCVRGRVVWHCSYSYPLKHRREIRGPVEAQAMKRRRARPAEIRAFEQLLLPLAFDGPANVDYRRRKDGSIAVLEINPRLGGSLMRPDNIRDLAGCLRAIVRHARWRPVAAAAATAKQDIVRA